MSEEDRYICDRLVEQGSMEALSFHLKYVSSIDPHQRRQLLRDYLKQMTQQRAAA